MPTLPTHSHEQKGSRSEAGKNKKEVVTNACRGIQDVRAEIPPVSEFWRNLGHTMIKC